MREQAHVPETLRSVRTPSGPLCAAVRVGGAPVHVCVMDVCTDGGVTVPICLCVCLQPSPHPDPGGREPTAGMEINQN